jgi:hypothetical protein
MSRPATLPSFELKSGVLVSRATVGPLVARPTGGAGGVSAT